MSMVGRPLKVYGRFEGSQLSTIEVLQDTGTEGGVDITEPTDDVRCW